MKIWTCKIGVEDDVELPDGADLPMRRAAQERFRRVTGREPDFCFSGWNGELDDAELEALRMKKEKSGS